MSTSAAQGGHKKSDSFRSVKPNSSL